VTFLCLPDDAAKESVALVDNPNTCVIDASTAHRVNPDWTFGLPELAKDQRAKIAASKRIANPAATPRPSSWRSSPLVAAGCCRPTRRSPPIPSPATPAAASR
jgi:N-acetyl-gamma-glutamyl-phosphate reductase